MLECRFAGFLYLGLPLSFKAQCLPQIKGGLCLAGCHVVAQTQGYHLVCIWGSLVKFQGGGVVVKTMQFVLEVQIPSSKQWVFVLLSWAYPLKMSGEFFANTAQCS